MKALAAPIVPVRALHRCEYCHLQQFGHRERFSTDHVITTKHGGANDDSNLAFACLRYNLFKGSNLTGVDHLTGTIVELFNPRRKIWDEHFGWDGESLIGRSPTGRASIAVMNMNAPERLLLRRS